MNRNQLILIALASIIAIVVYVKAYSSPEAKINRLIDSNKYSESIKLYNDLKSDPDFDNLKMSKIISRSYKELFDDVYHWEDPVKVIDLSVIDSLGLAEYKLQYEEVLTITGNQNILSAISFRDGNFKKAFDIYCAKSEEILKASSNQSIPRRDLKASMTGYLLSGSIELSSLTDLWYRCDYILDTINTKKLSSEKSNALKKYIDITRDFNAISTMIFSENMVNELAENYALTEADLVDLYNRAIHHAELDKAAIISNKLNDNYKSYTKFLRVLNLYSSKDFEKCLNELDFFTNDKSFYNQSLNSICDVIKFKCHDNLRDYNSLVSDYVNIFRSDRFKGDVRVPNNNLKYQLLSFIDLKNEYKSINDRFKYLFLIDSIPETEFRRQSLGNDNLTTIASEINLRKLVANKNYVKASTLANQMAEKLHYGLDLSKDDFESIQFMLDLISTNANSKKLQRIADSEFRSLVDNILELAAQHHFFEGDAGAELYYTMSIELESIISAIDSLNQTESPKNVFEILSLSKNQFYSSKQALDRSVEKPYVHKTVSSLLNFYNEEEMSKKLCSSFFFPWNNNYCRSIQKDIARYNIVLECLNAVNSPSNEFIHTYFIYFWPSAFEFSNVYEFNDSPLSYDKKQSIVNSALESIEINPENSTEVMYYFQLKEAFRQLSRNRND